MADRLPSLDVLDERSYEIQMMCRRLCVMAGTSPESWRQFEEPIAAFWDKAFGIPRVTPDQLAALREVLRISDRKHNAWDKAYAAVAALAALPHAGDAPAAPSAEQKVDLWGADGLATCIMEEASNCAAFYADWLADRTKENSDRYAACRKDLREYVEQLIAALPDQPPAAEQKVGELSAMMEKVQSLHTACITAARQVELEAVTRPGQATKARMNALDTMANCEKAYDRALSELYLAALPAPPTSSRG